MRKNLIIVRAGDQSLHPQWFNHKTERSWDLALSYFGDQADPYAGNYDYIHRFKGSKWQGLHDFCEQNAALIEQYDYIWLPDDDLLTDNHTIEAFFERCQQHQFALAQPALLISSYISHHVTLQRFYSDYRKSNFVEIMAPCLRQDFFQLVKPTFAINSSGWGLEWLWKDMADKHKMGDLAVVDSTPIYHSRPVSDGKNGGATAAPAEEQAALFKDYGLTEYPMRTISYHPSRFGLTRLTSLIHFLVVRVIYFSLKRKGVR